MGLSEARVDMGFLIELECWIGMRERPGAGPMRLMATSDTFLYKMGCQVQERRERGKRTYLCQFEMTTGRSNATDCIPSPSNTALTLRTYVTSICLAAFNVVVVWFADSAQANSARCLAPRISGAFTASFVSHIVIVLGLNRSTAPFFVPPAPAPPPWPCGPGLKMVVSLRESSNPLRTPPVAVSERSVAAREIRSPGP